MQRRLFLGGAALSVASLAATAGHAVSIALRRPLQRSYIVNRDHFAETATPHAGASLRLQRWRDRSFDPGTVKVLNASGAALGYLPTYTGGVIAALLDAGFGLDAEMLAHADDEPHIQIHINQCSAMQV